MMTNEERREASRRIVVEALLEKFATALTEETPSESDIEASRDAILAAFEIIGAPEKKGGDKCHS